MIAGTAQNASPATFVRKAVFWGTYDIGKPRNRIMLRAMRDAGMDVQECHCEVWRGIEDKSRVSGFLTRLHLIWKWLLAYPWLIIRYMGLPKHDFVFVGYLGHLDVLVLWPFARVRGVPIVWDAFLSLYETVVDDRRLLRRSHVLAHLLFAWEWLACRVADLIILDTQSHADYFVDRYSFPAERTAAIFVGAEPEVFTRRHVQEHRTANFTVLFYGQFIGLHGIETIVRAAQLARGSAIYWVIIGRGQEEARIREMLNADYLPAVRWIPWVPYEELIAWIQRADVCLGIFGSSDKASRVIPNKVFQALSAGKPIITRDSPAIRELVNDGMPGVFLVPPADERALFDAIRCCASAWNSIPHERLHREVVGRFSPIAIGHRLLELTQNLRGDHA